jgi:hypothetical protein
VQEISRPARLLLVVTAIVVTALAWGGISIRELLGSLHR